MEGALVGFIAQLWANKKLSLAVGLPALQGLKVCFV